MKFSFRPPNKKGRLGKPTAHCAKSLQSSRYHWLKRSYSDGLADRHGRSRLPDHWSDRELAKANIDGKPDEYRPEHHRHEWSDIDGKPNEYRPEHHRHEWSDIDGKPDEYRPEHHRHEWSDIDGKPDEYRPEHHVHNWSSINVPPDLETLLYILTLGNPGEVLTKTEYGFKWKKVEQTVVEQYVNIRTETPKDDPVTNAIVDSTGVFLVDSEGNYIEAL
jgi:hypothetical protein